MLVPSTEKLNLIRQREVGMRSCTEELAAQAPHSRM